MLACLVLPDLAHFGDLPDRKVPLHQDIHNSQPDRMRHYFKTRRRIIQRIHGKYIQLGVAISHSVTL
jgi:hypothetical protein